VLRYTAAENLTNFSTHISPASLRDSLQTQPTMSTIHQKSAAQRALRASFGDRERIDLHNE
jgi:hypothetical protein